MEQIIATIRSASESEKGALYETLYKENLPLLRKIASRYRGICARDRSVDVEDLLQTGFLALVAAASAYDPARGSWTQIASYYVRRAYRLTIGIYDGKPHAAFNALSLNSPASEDADMAFIDLLEDDSQPEIDELLLKSETAAVVSSALSSMKDQSASAVIRKIDLSGFSYKDVGREFGVTSRRVRSMRRAGYHELRRNPAMKRLADSYSLDERTHFYKHKGVTRFRADWSSVTEDAAVWRIENGKLKMEN